MLNYDSKQLPIGAGCENASKIFLFHLVTCKIWEMATYFFFHFLKEWKLDEILNKKVLVLFDFLSKKSFK